VLILLPAAAQEHASTADNQHITHLTLEARQTWRTTTCSCHCKSAHVQLTVSTARMHACRVRHAKPCPVHHHLLTVTYELCAAS
jgi:hypothetical protein